MYYLKEVANSGKLILGLVIKGTRNGSQNAVKSRKISFTKTRFGGHFILVEILGKNSSYICCFARTASGLHCQLFDTTKGEYSWNNWISTIKLGSANKQRKINILCENLGYLSLLTAVTSSI